MATVRTVRTAVVAVIMATCAAAVTAGASGSGASGVCGTDFGDFDGEFAVAGEPSNVVRFDGAGGVTFHSDRLGSGEGIYVVVPTGGFTATMRMTDPGPGDVRPANTTASIKSTSFQCPGPGTRVGSFDSVDQSGRRFGYSRTS